MRDVEVSRGRLCYKAFSVDMESVLRYARIAQGTGLGSEFVRVPEGDARYFVGEGAAKPVPRRASWVRHVSPGLHHRDAAGEH